MGKPKVAPKRTKRTTNAALQAKLDQLAKLAAEDNIDEFVKIFVPLDLSADDLEHYLYVAERKLLGSVGMRGRVRTRMHARVSARSQLTSCFGPHYNYSCSIPVGHNRARSTTLKAEPEMWANLKWEIQTLASGTGVKNIEGDQEEEAIFQFDLRTSDALIDREVVFLCKDGDWRAEG